MLVNRSPGSAARMGHIMIVGRVLLGIGESFILTGNLTSHVAGGLSTHAGQVISSNGMATYGALAIGAPLLSFYAGRPGASGAPSC